MYTCRSSALQGATLLPPRNAITPRSLLRSSSQNQRGRSSTLIVRADRDGGSFWSGFVLGGVVCGVLGFVFAPQISEALLGDDQRLRLPRFMEEEEEDPEVTRQNLADKIAQLNSAIDEVSSQLKANEVTREEVNA